MSTGESGTQGAWAGYAARPADPASLTALATSTAADLTGPDLVDAIIASEKALSLLTGLQMRLMAALAVPFVAGDPSRLAARMARKNCITGDDNPDNVRLFIDEAATCLAAAEIAAALRISPVTSGIRVREATTMTTDLAPTLRSLETGTLDRGKARIIAEHCQPLTPDHTTELQDLVLPDAADLSTSELRELTGEAVIIVDPDGSEDRHRAAAARRDLTLRAQPDAMATLSAFLTADGAVKIFQMADLLATSTAGAAGDPRGIGARRIDALVDVADHLMTHGYLDLADFIDHPASAPATADAAGRTNPADTADPNEPATGPEPPAGPEPDRTAEHGQGQGQAPEGAHGDLPNEHREPDDTNGVNHQPSNPGTPNSQDTAPGIPLPTAPAPAAPAPASAPESASAPEGSAPAPAASAPPPIDPGRPAPTNRSRRALTRQGRRPHLSVTIGLDTLAGLNELPGKLAGFGAIPASLARAIATSAGTITALITDPTTGIATNAGALTYRPTQQLRDHIAALLNTCQFPSCRQPVWRCDIDHREPFNHRNPTHGGRTDEENTGPFCRRHHLMKPHTDWQVRVNTERFTLDWTSPTGHRYSTKPRPAAIPDQRNLTLRVTTACTATAERLDTLTAFNNTSNTADQPPDSTSTIEELLTALLLRHKLNQPKIYYDPDETRWDRTATDRSINDPENRIDDAELPDEPPF